MAVRVVCPRCGTEHASRTRARGEAEFQRINAAIGSIVEWCPTCGAARPSHPGDRAWRDDLPQPAAASPAKPGSPVAAPSATETVAAECPDGKLNRSGGCTSAATPVGISGRARVTVRLMS